MAAGIATGLANDWLNTLRNVSYVEAATYVGLHTGNPGTAGTSNVSSVTTRPAISFSAASGGAMSMSNTPTWSSWAGINGEVVTYISVWDANSSGNFLFSAQLTASKTINTGDTFTLSTCTVTFTTAS